MGDRSNEGGPWSLFGELGSTGFDSPRSAPPSPPPPAPDWNFGGVPRAPRRPIGRIVGAVAVVLALAAGSFLYLSLNRSNSPAALAFSMPAGSRVSYRVHMKVTGTLGYQGRSIPLTMDLSETLSE